MKNIFFTQKTFHRFMALAIAAVMLLSFAACGKDSSGVSSGEAVTNLKAEDLDPAIMEFLSRFTDWYFIEGSGTVYYDSEKAGEGDTNILRCILGDAGCADWTKYPVSEPKDVYNQKKLDPKKWAKESGGAYKVFNADDADWIARNIFNVSDDALEAMRAQGEKNKWFYLKNGKYYKVIGGVGDPFTVYEVNLASRDGTVYYINYSCYYDAPDGREFRSAYTAEIQQKTIEDKDYWTLLKFGEEEIAG
ncbi:MAG: hypothetical protein IJM51_07675 [Clostridia bacterium]|nr:hypothetical protein [Clostridia bacterium]